MTLTLKVNGIIQDCLLKNVNGCFTLKVNLTYNKPSGLITSKVVNTCCEIPDNLFALSALLQLNVSVDRIVGSYSNKRNYLAT